MNDKKFEKFIEHNKTVSMTNEDINKYFPKSKIIKYSELKNYNNIEQLLPNNKSHFFLLYQLDSPNSGHWCLVARHNNKIYFFDSYGIYPDDELSWIKKEELINLDIHEPYLSHLFDKSKMPVYYNKVKYQTENDNINTCGRHVTYFLMNLIEKDRDLNQYFDIMQETKKKLKTSYDKIVGGFIVH
jgi:hypothetical protein